MDGGAETLRMTGIMELVGDASSVFPGLYQGK